MILDRHPRPALCPPVAECGLSRILMKAIALLAAFFFCVGFARGHIHTYQAVLSGANEDAPNGSVAVGTSTVTLDLDLITMRVEIHFSGLSGTTTTAFLHGNTPFPLTGIAGQMSPALTTSGFPVGVQSGNYDFTFDLTGSPGYDPGFITTRGGTVSDALNALIAGFEEGRVYLGIGTTAFPSGEIRGFFSEAPEPPPTLQLVARPDSSGLLTLTAVGPAETASILQTSPDLIAWIDVETIHFTGQPQPVIYQATPGESQRFFRLRLP